jgi:DNA-binding protein HU-beta
MKKADIISHMAEEAGITKAQAEKAMDGLQDGGKVAFMGFGTFSVAERKARAGRNPKTGEVIQIPESRTVKFTPSEKLKNEFQTL